MSQLCLPSRGQLPVLLMTVFVEVDGDMDKPIVLHLENICKTMISPHISLCESAIETSV